MTKIAVIADDLTGAAEVAGAALRYGLTAEVQVGQFCPANADVIVVDADSRSQSVDVAFARVFTLTQQIRDAGVDLIYKKVDSLLRGPVLTEVTAMRLAAGLQRCLLVCANPRKHRTVSSGKISVNEVPLHQTEFALDPEHPRHTDSVLELLRGERCETEATWDISVERSLSVVSPGEVSDATVAIGDVSSTADLDCHVHQWLSRREATLAAGSAEYFEAILRGVVQRHEQPQAGWESDKSNQRLQVSDTNALMVSGTRLSRCEGWAIVDLQPTIPLATCIKETQRVLAAHGRAAICAAEMLSGSHSERVQLVTDVTVGLLSSCVLEQVWIEGGRTASNLIRAMGIQRLLTLAEVGDGIVVLAMPGEERPLLIVKPGSYPWPHKLIDDSPQLAESRIREVV